MTALHETYDEVLNNLLATGALAATIELGIARGAGLSYELEMVEGIATNCIIVRTPFLASSYRVTVERIPDDF